ncbi:MAG: hypothetical protein DI623_13705 [Sphingomonas sanxanigenens]|uniref:Uncharacterized protein n=1 Tax=Sphingomonas sanxanigenens TaxID=397260 RepID=A0A2W5A041_9SPHN|nr:MAG: hypothetical protein DI623_13705 [Sphingomonas sanxanigenens]
MSYSERLSTANMWAGQADGGWNRRFRAALEDLGLQLISQTDLVEILGRDAVMQVCYAPLAFGPENGWPADTLVVEASQVRW